MSENQFQTLAKIPNCLGIIPDGNRRWARERGLPTLEGHRKGSKKLREILDWCEETRIKNVVVFAFSTENWRRTKDEVGYLLELLKEKIKSLAEDDNGKVSFHFVGQLEAFGESFVREMRALEEKTTGREYHLYIALSYGGRAEILDGVKRLLRDRDGEKLEDLTEEGFEKYLWSAGMPDPDLIIRTSGEKRVSGFMTWKSVYSEFAFVDSYFPAFTKEEFFAVLADYANRERRRGK